MRLNRPFKELLEFSKKWPLGFTDVDIKESSHVPYGVILMHVLRKYWEKHPNEMPSSKNKSELAEIL